MLELMMRTDDETFEQIWEKGNFDEPQANKDEPQVGRKAGVQVENPLAGVSRSARCADDSWHKDGFTPRQLDKLRRAQAQARYDYHGDTVDKAYARLSGHLSQALAAGHDVIELIHGKGTGTLREAVRGWLRACPYVLAYIEMPDNSGSVLARLKTKAGG